MATEFDATDLAKLGPRERTFIESIEDEERRSTVACSIIKHRLGDKLAVGDRVPDLALQRLGGDDTVHLRGFVGDRPLLLVFGSYT